MLPVDILWVVLLFVLSVIFINDVINRKQSEPQIEDAMSGSLAKDQKMAKKST